MEVSPDILWQKLFLLLKNCSLQIRYIPLSGEMDFALSLLTLLQTQEYINISQEKSLDPFSFAENIIEEYGKESAYVLVPGSFFDKEGNRKGRGGGWYDKFLSRIPEEWIRIGCLPKEKLSENILKKEAWDEPMDWLLVEEEKNKLYKVLETKARKK